MEFEIKNIVLFALAPKNEHIKLTDYIKEVYRTSTKF